MKIIHLIPQDGLGGVEQAARSLDPPGNLDIKVAFLRGESLVQNSFINLVSGPSTTLNSPRFYIKGLTYLLHEKPDILVCSLWRSNLIGIIYTIYRKLIVRDKFKFIFFVHATKFTHLLDKTITTISSLIANEIWCDSKASRDAFNKRGRFYSKLKVISFYLKQDFPPASQKQTIKNNFVFWGRLAKVKRIDKAIHFFYEVYKYHPNSLFYIYGPDCGELDSLTKLAKDLGLQDNVFFMGPKNPNEYSQEITSAKFFINTSDHEGMGVAITEAMQIGLIPIVTEVGEIANYCKDGINSIYYSNNALERVLKILKDNTKYKQLSNNACEYWKNKKSYSEDFIENCLRVKKND